MCTSVHASLGRAHKKAAVLHMKGTDGACVCVCTEGIDVVFVYMRVL